MQLVYCLFRSSRLRVGDGRIVIKPAACSTLLENTEKLVSDPIINTSTTDSCVVCIKRYVNVKVTLTVIISLADMCA